MIRGAPKTTKGRWRRFVHTLVRALRGALLLHDTPHRIAVGVGSGVFCAFLPIIGQTVVGMVVARLLRGNVVASLPWNLISNPFTYVPLFYACYRVGLWVVPGEYTVVSFERVGQIMEAFQHLSIADGFARGYEVLADIVVPLMVGSVLSGIAAGMVAYLIARRLVTGIQHRRLERITRWRLSAPAAAPVGEPAAGPPQSLEHR